MNVLEINILIAKQYEYYIKYLASEGAGKKEEMKGCENKCHHL